MNRNSTFGLSVVTGAAGGVGLAAARLLGRKSALLVSDLRPEQVAATVALLRDEGFEVEGVAGDLAALETIERLKAAAAQIGSLRYLVNTAGLSPALADWKAILAINCVAAIRLLDGFEALLVPGSAAVMVASVAGHIGARDEEAERLLAEPLRAGLFKAIEPRLRAVLEQVPGSLEGHAYSFSKRSVIRACEVRANRWGALGARINSVSPGGLWTKMGRAESSVGQRVNALIASTPAGRWGTAMEIATAIDFLLSPCASYITGTDLRVDGGAVAALRETVI